MRPVSAEFEASQEFGEGATAGVAPSWTPDTVGWYVRLYGNYQEYGHAGKDIKCPIGTPIHAPADGTVLYAGWTEDLPGTGNVRKWLLYYNFGGIVTVIQHDGWISVIAHQSDNNAVHAGMKVKEGQIIGKSGNTKTRTTYVAPHVHCEALVYMDYRTDVQRGIIYGRVNPDRYFGSASIAPQGTITKEDELSAAEVKEIKDHINAVMLGGYTWEGKRHPGVGAVVEENQRRITAVKERSDKYIDAPVSAVPGKVWNETVTRDGKQISVKQELADAKTLAEKATATLAAQVALAKDSGLTPEQITAAVKDALDDGTVTVDFNLAGSK